MTICDTCVEHDGCEDRRRWKKEYGIEPGGCSDYEQRKTNANRIRSMSDEELAEWIIDDLIEPGYYTHEQGFKMWLDWLKQEVD